MMGQGWEGGLDMKLTSVLKGTAYSLPWTEMFMDS